MCRRSSSCASEKYIRFEFRLGAARQRSAVSFPAWFPFRRSHTSWSRFGLGHQEAAQEDAQAQAQEDAEEDALAAARARLATGAGRIGADGLVDCRWGRPAPGPLVRLHLQRAGFGPQPDPGGLVRDRCRAEATA